MDGVKVEVRRTIQDTYIHTHMYIHVHTCTPVDMYNIHRYFVQRVYVEYG